MEWVETTGKSIEEAQEAALDELGVDAQDAEFEVLEEPKHGLFGLMRAEARIRARVRPTTPRAKEDRRDRRRRSKGSGDSSRPASATTADTTEADRPSRPSRSHGARGESETRSQAASSDASGPAESSEPDGDTATSAPPRPRTNPSRRRGRGGSRPAASGPGDESGPGDSTAGGQGASAVDVPAAAVDADDSSVNGAGESRAGTSRAPRNRNRKRSPRSSASSNDDGTDAVEGTLMDVALDEQGKVAEQFLAGLVDSFGLSADIAVNIPDDDTIDIQVTGADLGLLIGPKGSTLLAVQDITRTVVQRKTSAGNGRIFIDVGGYRQKRNEALSRFAQKVAADVIASQAKVAMEPMSAPDRKTVHDTITDIDGVETISVGEDAARHVVVLPAAV